MLINMLLPALFLYYPLPEGILYIQYSAARQVVFCCLSGCILLSVRLYSAQVNAFLAIALLRNEVSCLALFAQVNACFAVASRCTYTCFAELSTFFYNINELTSLYHHPGFTENWPLLHTIFISASQQAQFRFMRRFLTVACTFFTISRRSR